jgi:hypothetical protein
LGREQGKKSIENKMNFTHSILQQMGYKLDPDGNYSRTETNTPRVSDAKPKPVVRKTLQNTNKAQERSKKRISLRITRYATRLLDEDNLAGAKLAIDQLRYAGIIPNDDPGSTKIILDQIKVKNKTEERTEIEIKEL